MADIVVPAQLAVSGVGVPDVCTRHGEPAVIRPKTIFQTRPPSWSYFLILLGALPYLVVVLALRKRITAPGWPMCARCRGRRRTLRLVALGLFLLTILSFAAGFVTTGDSELVAAAIIVAFVAFLGWAIALNLSAEGVLARGDLTQDGQSLRLRRVSPAFAAALPTATPPR